jgi:hypothetical protein
MVEAPAELTAGFGTPAIDPEAARLGVGSYEENEAKLRLDLAEPADCQALREDY